MALKNLFDMAKADRYTADGREALIKAQEAETEDKVYQIGEISQKTGLQKTANGWVKPKNGAGRNHGTEQKKRGPGAIHTPGKGSVGMDKMKEAAEKGLKGQELKEFMTGAKSEPGPDRDDSPERAAYERELSRQQAQRAADDPRGFGYEEPPMEPAAEKPERFDYRSSLEKNPRDAFSFKGTVNHSIPINQYHYDELQNLASFMREEKATYQNALKNRAQALVDGHKANGDWEPKKEQALMDIAKAVGFDEELHKFIAEENRGYDLGYSEDAAPSLSEIVDRVYNIGEISEKTGLQKTAQGWKPPKETKFGKVKQNKEGQWGVQVKQGKGSDFLKHKSEAEAKRALSNYTAGYNTTARSKEDPHSDKARQVKQWRKEDEKAAKARRAEGRAEHAAQFQNQPALSQTDGKGNKVEIKITESKGGGFYVDKYVNGKKVGINNANTKESAEAKAKSMMEQHMADPDYKAESKPAAQKEIGKFYTKFKDVQEAYDAGRDTYPEGGYKIYNTPQGYKVIGNEAAKIQQRMEEAGYEVETEVPEGTKPPRYPGDTPAKRQSATRQRGEELAQPADKRQDEGYQHWLGVLPGYKDGSLLEQRKKLQESVDEFEEDMQDYDRRGLASAVYGKRIDQKNWQIGALKAIDEEMERRGMDPAPRTSVPDAAPRVLTGDTRIRVRKEKAPLTGDTRIKVRK